MRINKLGFTGTIVKEKKRGLSARIDNVLRERVWNENHNKCVRTIHIG